MAAGSITRRRFLKESAIGIGILTAASQGFGGPGAVDNPNIVLIVADDLGWGDVGFHGSDIRTPSLDRLAREGVELTRYYVCPVCSPTRSGLMTGRYPIRFGMQSGVCKPDVLHGMPTDEFTLPKMLAQVGYKRRACIGKWHLGHASTMFHPLRQGFTYFYGHYNGALDYFTHKRRGQLDWHRNYESCYDKGYTTDLLGNEAVKFVNESKKNEPFFLYVPFNAPHSPIQAKTEDLESYGFDKSKPLVPVTVANMARREGDPEYGQTGRGNTRRQTFAAMVTAMDRQIGRILDAIDRQGLRNNTVVLFHSDNGADPDHSGTSGPLRGDKGTVSEGGVRVPAIIRWPSRISDGVKCEALMGYIDVWPTLAEAIGFTGEKPKELDGVSMLGVIQGKSKASERSFYLGKKAVVTQNWKLVGNKLFAIDKDPCEKENVASQHPEIVKKLRADVKRFDALSGPKIQSKLIRRQGQWPRPEWKIPQE